MIDAETLTTPNLILRPLDLEDAEALFPAFHDPETMRWWHTLPHSALLVTRIELGGIIRNEGCWWTIRLRPETAYAGAKTGEAIGYVGYHNTSGTAGFGYLLHRNYWRQGISTEAARAALDYGFRTWEIERVELWIHERNQASLQLARKLGCRERGQMPAKFPQEDQPHTTLVYGLTREEWPNAPARPRPTHTFYGVEPVLAVHDVEATATFYRDRLGFEIEFLYGDPPTHAGVARGVWTPQKARLQLTQAIAETPLHPLGWLYFHVGQQLDALFTAYQAQGVEIVLEPENRPWGRREFTIADNNGYRLRFGMPL